MSQLIAELESASGRAATAEAAAQEARIRAQQLEAAATTAQQTVERMQTANQDLIKTCARYPNPCVPATNNTTEHFQLTDARTRIVATAVAIISSTASA
jgi:multidrug efflux pump subunit AcrA (membrane-fusion protein)